MTFSRLLPAVIGALFLVVGAPLVCADAPSDAALAEAVRAKLLEKDPEFLNAAKIEVSGGVVTLKGWALKPTSLVKAIQLSQSVPGVVRVVNRVVPLQ
jgi:osmotically-inducible protein OsmY